MAMMPMANTPMAIMPIGRTTCLYRVGELTCSMLYRGYPEGSNGVCEERLLSHVLYSCTAVHWEGWYQWLRCLLCRTW